MWESQVPLPPPTSDCHLGLCSGDGTAEVAPTPPVLGPAWPPLGSLPICPSPQGRFLAHAACLPLGWLHPRRMGVQVLVCGWSEGPCLPLWAQEYQVPSRHCPGCWSLCSQPRLPLGSLPAPRAFCPPLSWPSRWDCTWDGEPGTPHSVLGRAAPQSPLPTGSQHPWGMGAVEVPAGKGANWGVVTSRRTALSADRGAGPQPLGGAETEDQPGPRRLLGPRDLPAGRPAVGRGRPGGEARLRGVHPEGAAGQDGRAGDAPAAGDQTAGPPAGMGAAPGAAVSSPALGCPQLHSQGGRARGHVCLAEPVAPQAAGAHGGGFPPAVPGVL